MRWLGAAGGLRQPTKIVDLGVSRNGRFAVTSDPVFALRVFDLTTEQCTAEVKAPAKWRTKYDHLDRVSVSDDGRFVVGHLHDWAVGGDVTKWEPAVYSSSYFSRSIARPDGGWVHSDRAQNIDIAADGRVAASLWNGETEAAALRLLSAKGKVLLSIDSPVQTYLARVGFADDEHVVALTQEGYLLRWDLRANKLRKSKLGKDYRTERLLAPLNVVVARGGVVDLSTGKPIAKTTASLWAVSADGKVVVSADGSTITRRDPKTFAELAAAPVLRTAIRDLRFEGDSLWTLDDERMHRWSVSEGRVETTVEVKGQPRAFAGSSAVVETNDKLSRVSLPDGKPAASGAIEDTRFVPAMTHDGSLVARRSETEIRIVTWAGKSVVRWDARPTRGLMWISLDDKYIAVINRYESIELRKLPSGKLVTEIELSDPVFALAISPDTSIAICTDAAAVTLLKGSISQRLKMPKKTTGPVAFSPDGEWLAASDQTTTVIWAAKTGTPHKKLKAGAHALAFSPDSTLLALGCDGALGLVTL